MGSLRKWLGMLLPMAMMRIQWPWCKPTAPASKGCAVGFGTDLMLKDLGLGARERLPRAGRDPVGWAGAQLVCGAQLDGELGGWTFLVCWEWCGRATASLHCLASNSSANLNSHSARCGRKFSTQRSGPGSDISVHFEIGVVMLYGNRHGHSGQSSLFTISERLIHDGFHEYDVDASIDVSA